MQSILGRNLHVGIYRSGDGRVAVNCKKKVLEKRRHDTELNASKFNANLLNSTCNKIQSVKRTSVRRGLERKISPLGPEGLRTSPNQSQLNFCSVKLSHWPLETKLRSKKSPITRDVTPYIHFSRNALPRTANRKTKYTAVKYHERLGTEREISPHKFATARSSDWFHARTQSLRKASALTRSRFPKLHFTLFPVQVYRFSGYRESFLKLEFWRNAISVLLADMSAAWEKKTKNDTKGGAAHSLHGQARVPIGEKEKKRTRTQKAGSACSLCTEKCFSNATVCLFAPRIYEAFCGNVPRD